MVKSKNEDIARQMDELLGKPPVHGQISKKELSSKEDELLNLRVKLQQKERNIENKERKLVAETKELEKELLGLKKERADLWGDVDELRSQKEKNSEILEKIKKEIKDRKKEIRNAEEVHKSIVKKQEDFKKKAFELNNRETEIVNKEKNISSLNKTITEKEIAMNKLSNLVNVERTEFEEQRKKLLEEMDSMQKQKILLNAEITALKSEYSIENKRLSQTMKDVHNLYETAEKKNAAIDKKYSIVEKGLNKREEELTKLSLNLDKREMELKNWNEELEKERQKLEMQKKEEDALRKNIIELTTEERMLEQTTTDKRKQLELLNMDYQTKIEDMKRDHQLLDEKENEIIHKIKQMEDDKNELNEKEDEFIEKIHELEKDKRVFDSKVDEFSELLDAAKDIKSREEQVKKWELDLEAKEQKIIKTAEFKANIANLKKEKEKLEKEFKLIQAKVSKVDAINKKLIARERMLSEKEERIRTMFEQTSENRAEKTSNELMSYTGNVQMTPFEFENKEDEAKTTFELVEEKNPKNYDVLSLMQDARHALGTKNITNAKNIYSRLNTLYKKLPATIEKKKIYYEILELKTDIELASV